MRTISPEPLTRDAYAPFGDLVAANDTWRPANEGTAKKSEHLAELKDLRGCNPNVSVFRCQPRALPHRITLLEKHAASTQLFVPMSASRYLVIVALGGERPDLSTLRVFSASGTQAITYRPGVWHHTLVALDRESDFFCLVYEDGTAVDCTEVGLAEAEQVLVG